MDHTPTHTQDLTTDPKDADDALDRLAMSDPADAPVIADEIADELADGLDSVGRSDEPNAV